MAAELPGLKEDIFALYESILTGFHISTNYVLCSQNLDALAKEYIKGHQTRVFGSALNVAVKLRSFFDIYRKNILVSEFLNFLPNQAEGNSLFVSAVPEILKPTLRDSCNKIIHSLEVEFILGTKVDSYSITTESELTESNKWEETKFLTHRVMLNGIFESKPWVCTIDLVVFCSLAYLVLQWAESGALKQDHLCGPLESL